MPTRTMLDVAALYHDQGKYAEADQLYQRALMIEQNALGAEHLDTTTTLNNLASL